MSVGHSQAASLIVLEPGAQLPALLAPRAHADTAMLFQQPEEPAESVVRRATQRVAEFVRSGLFTTTASFVLATGSDVSATERYAVAHGLLAQLTGFETSLFVLADGAPLALQRELFPLLFGLLTSSPPRRTISMRFGHELEKPDGARALDHHVRRAEQRGYRHWQSWV